MLESLQHVKIHGKLPGHKHSRSNLFTKVADVAGAIHLVKGVYDAGKFLYNAGRVAAPYMMGAAAVILNRHKQIKWGASVNFETMPALSLAEVGGKPSRSWGAPKVLSMQATMSIKT